MLGLGSLEASPAVLHFPEEAGHMSVPKQTRRKTSSRRRKPGGRSYRGAALDPDQLVFRNLVEAARSMIAVLRSDGTIMYFNAFAVELTGCPREEVLGKAYFETFVPQMARAAVEEQFQRVLSGMPSPDVQHPLLAKGAPVRWVVCSFRSFGSYRGEPAVLLTAQDITVHKHTEETLQQRTHDLGERIKELNCLFGLSKLVEEPEIDLEGIFQGLVDILPPGWQYPEATCGRVIFENREFKTYNFRRTSWKQAAPIMLYGQLAGAIEVYYLEGKPPSYEGPFLAEERRLLDALAEQLGRIAERIKAEQELRRERDFAESLIETASAIVLVLDAQGRIVRINPYMEEISGYRLEEVKGKDWFRAFLPQRNRQRMRRLFLESAGKTQRRGQIDPIVVRDGREREIEWYEKALQDAGGNPMGLLAIGQDITDRRKLEKEISEISTREQQRIGQELHDGLGQELTGLGYLAETLHCDLEDRGAPEAETANRLARGIEHALDQARAIAKGLVPVEIDAEGLVSALAQLVSNTQTRCGVTCRLHCNEPVAIAATATATQLFRIIQEAINNAAKHARAKHIDVELAAADSQVVFQVRDDGVGIPADLERATGMGLRIMHHRAGVIGASLSVRPADGGGTLVRCSLPRRD
jgi:PAS domain S-box-containing protein